MKVFVWVLYVCKPTDVIETPHEILVAAVERAINEADPVGLLHIGAPSDEYSPEVGTIVPRLASAVRLDDVAAVLHEEFVRWFGAGIAGPRERSEMLARPIWDALSAYRRGTDEGELRLSRRSDELKLPSSVRYLAPTHGDRPVTATRLASRGRASG